MRELKLNSKLTIIFYLILGITSVYDIFYRGGEKLPRLALIAITILGLNLIYKKTFFKNSKINVYTSIFFKKFNLFLIFSIFTYFIKCINNVVNIIYI